MTKFSSSDDDYYDLVEYHIERVAAMDPPPPPTAAEAARSAWGSKQGNNVIANSTLTSQGDMRVGNFNN
jgi:hypothetical protein